MLSLSMEIELGWGSVFNNPPNPHAHLSGPDRQLETKRLRQLLNLCDEHEIPISFDVVSHLLLDECTGHNSPHKEWFQKNDPQTSVSADPLYYAPDLVSLVNNSDTAHEICTHTYSHIPVDEMSDEVLDWELKHSQSTHDESGYATPTSLVSPQHRSTPIGVLAENGIQVLRTPNDDNGPIDGYPQNGNPVERLLWNFTRNPPIADPELIDNVLRVYCSSGPSLTSILLPAGQSDPHQIVKAVPQRIRKRIHRSYLSEALTAAESGDNVHLWCHLWDLANGIQWPLVKDFLEDVGRAKASGMPMATLQRLGAQYA